MHLHSKIRSRVVFNSRSKAVQCLWIVMTCLPKLSQNIKGEDVISNPKVMEIKTKFMVTMLYITIPCHAYFNWSPYLIKTILMAHDLFSLTYMRATNKPLHA